MSDVEGLRQEIAEALDPDDDRSPLYGMEWLLPRVIDAVLPVVTAWAERQARSRAAEELEWAATEVECGHDLRMLKRRAADLADDGRA